MIARVCSAFVISDRIEEFVALLRNEIMPVYTSTDGILSVIVLQRKLAGYIEIMILSIWESNDAVVEFAGRQSLNTGSLSELGVIQKEIANFELERVS